MKKFATAACLGLLLAGFAKIVAAQSGLSISPNTLPDGTAGNPYLETLTPSGGSGTGYQFSITSGAASLTALGLSFSATTGAISGTPTAGTASFTVRLTDSASDTVSQAYTFSVNTVAVLYSFGGTNDGDEPTMIIQALDGNFYGITSFGGGQGNCSSDGCGTIFKLVHTGSTWTESSPPLYSFSGGANGGIPSSLIQSPGGKIFVTTLIGGPDSSKVDICQATDGSGNPAPCCLDLNDNPVTCGAIFEFDPSQAAPITLNPIYTFSGGTDGAYPGTLIPGSTEANAKSILGTTMACSNCSFSVDDAGFESFGTVFSFVPAANIPVKPTTIVSLLSSNTSLAYPNSLIQWDMNTLYGTTQMGGDSSSSTAPCPTNGFGGFGCGGIFSVDLSTESISELCDFGVGSGCVNAPSIQGATSTKHNDTSRTLSPEKTVIRQSGIRFPVGGETWNYSTVPMALVMDSSGNIYGTTPPGCIVGSNYSADPDCPITTNSPSAEPSSVYEFTPPGSSSSNGTMDSLLYPFSGNNTQVPPPPTPGGTIAGLTLATDNNFYGLSGDGSTLSEMFTAQSSGITQYASLDPGYTPTWMIQGSDGNFYGTSPAGGANGFGAVFEVLPANPLPSPVQLSFTPSQITLGNSATLTWRVPNAFSLSSQRCYQFADSSESGAGTWSGLGAGSVSSGVFSNSALITPTGPGTFNYAVTCGGITSGYTTLEVNLAALTISPAKLPAGTAKTSYSELLTASGGSTKGYDFSIASGAASLASLGLSLTTAGLISGTPTAGTASFTVQLTDSLGDNTSQPFTLVVNQAVPTIKWTPPAAITYGTALSGTQLDASAEFNGSTVAGTLAYSPALGAVPSGGQQTLSVTFTPSDATDYTTATQSVTLIVNQASQTVSFPALPTLTYGEAPFTLSATTTSGLPVSFVSTTPTVCTVSGTTLTLVAAQEYCTIQASQAGNADYRPAPTMTQSTWVYREAQTITFAAVPTQNYGAPPITLSATATSGLTVGFATTTSSVCTVSGTTATIVSLGNCTIEATQAGNGDYQAATTVTRTFAVIRATQTITFGPPATQTYGAAPFTLVATDTSGLPISFATTTPGVCTISGTTLTVVSIGSCSVEATQAGNTDYYAAPPITRIFAIIKATQNITFATPADQTYGEAPFMISGSATSHLTVSFASTTPSICTVSDTTVTLVGAAADCTIKATQAGNTDYYAAPPITRSFWVYRESQTIDFASPGSQKVGTPLTLAATASSGLAVTFTSTTNSICTVSGTTATFIAAGSCTIQAAQAGNSDYQPATTVIRIFAVAAN